MNNIVINDITTLENMKRLCYIKDNRPVWVGGGIAHTDVPEYQLFALWANLHWAMYCQFVDRWAEESTDILDVGCGCGFCTLNLKTTRPGAFIVGIDIDEEPIAFAKNHNTVPGIEYVQADILAYKTDRKFDKIFFVDTLEHIKHEKQDAVLDFLLSLLKDEKSRLYITTPKSEDCLACDRGHVGTITEVRYALLVDKYGRHTESRRQVSGYGDVCHYVITMKL